MKPLAFLHNGQRWVFEGRRLIARVYARYVPAGSDRLSSKAKRAIALAPVVAQIPDHVTDPHGWALAWLEVDRMEADA